MMMLLIGIVLYGLNGARGGRRDRRRNVHEPVLFLVAKEQWVANDAVVEDQADNYHGEDDGYDSEC